MSDDRRVGKGQARSGQAPAVAPRKLPRQSRSAGTVEAIVEAAARLLDRDGASRFTTNTVAEVAGVSIGSLYQYFPNKDAITRALIERQAKLVAAEARAALATGELDRALAALVDVAVRNQLDRPRLALLLEDEEARLAHSLDLEAESLGVREALATLLRTAVRPGEAEWLAGDVMRVIRVLADAAGARGGDVARTTQAIVGAVRGLVAAMVEGHATRAAGGRVPAPAPAPCAAA